MNDVEDFSFEIFCRPEAWYLRAQWQDVQGSWWQSGYVVRIDPARGASGLADDLAEARRATRRDLPAPKSWAESPPDPGVSLLLESSGEKSVRAFLKPAQVFTLYIANGLVEVCRARVTGRSLIGLGSTKKIFDAGDYEGVFAVLAGAGVDQNPDS